MNPIVKPGDRVRLLPREHPHKDDPYLWWTVREVADTGFTASWESASGHLEWRHDVAWTSIKAIST
jgi:hypothetical protein